MATSTITVKTGGEWVKFDTLGYTFENGKEYTLQVLGSAKFGDDGKNGILIDNSEPYTFTKKSGVDLYVLTNDPTGAVVTVSDKITLGLATKGGSGGGSVEAVWGDITGTLADQTDLAEALAAKQNTLTAGTGIDITNDVISATGGGDTPESILDARTETAIRLWTGNQTQYNNGGTVTFYNWQSDGVTIASTSISFTPKDIAYGNGKYIAVGTGGAIYSSTDKENWIAETSGVNVDLNGIAYGNNKFIAVGNSGTIISSSGDGTWTAETVSESGNLTSICFGNNVFVTSSIGLYSSGDGTWTNSNRYGSKIFIDGYFYSVGFGRLVDYYSDLEIYKSADGASFTYVSSAGSVSESGPFTFKILGAGSNIYVSWKNGDHQKYSSDGGTTWSTYSGTFPTDVVYDGTTYYGLINNTLQSSSNGTTWDSIGLATGITYLCYGNALVGVGGSTTLKVLTYGASLSVYTTDENPTTSSIVYSEPNVTSALTITSVGTGTITLSDTNTYSYNSAGNQTVTQTVGQAHPDWLCFIEGVGIKMGNVSFIPTVDQTYNASSTNAQSGVAVASGISDTLGTINTSLESIIAQGD